MPTLDLVIDARGAEQGARQAETALKSVATQATTTERAFTGVSTRVASTGTALNAAFAATSGGLSVTRGIATAAQGMQQLNAATVGFATATALLDASRLANDFRTVASTATEVRRDIYGVETVVKSSSGAWSSFGAVLKAHPILTIATVISAASTLMAAFSSSTKQASDSWKEFGTSLSKARIDEKAANFLGLSPQTAQRAQLDALFKLVSEQLANPEKRRVDALAGSLGQSQLDIVRGLSGVGNENAGQYLRSGQYQYESLRQIGNTPSRPIYGTELVSSSDIGNIVATPEQIRELIRNYYRSLVSTQAKASLPNDVNLTGTGGVPDYLRRPGNGPVVTASAVEPYGTGTVLIGDQQRQEVDYERQRRAQDEAAQRMDELIDKGRQFGATIGDAFFNVASGAQTARQAIQGLLLDLARAASRQAFSNVFGAVVGATQTQTTQNSTPSGSNIQLP